MEKKLAELIALFRYKIIAAALEKGIRQKEYFARQAEKTWDVPGYGTKHYTVSAFKSWLADYRAGGFEALFPSTRNDTGTSRKITPELAKVIGESAADFTGARLSVFYRFLDSQGIINPPYVSESALRRFASARHLLKRTAETVPRKKYEKEHINELWISDTMHGPHLSDSKKKRKSYLIAIIDDHSRMIVASGWFFAENTLALETVLKEAIRRFGLPEIFYCDNGSIFSSQSLQLSCARLGIVLRHSKPYDSPSRGKIERMWRRVRDQFLSTLPAAGPIGIQQINDLFAGWLESDYHKSFHHGIEARPIDRWLADAKVTRIRKLSDEELDWAFYQSFERKVKNDSTVALDGKLWEAPARYIGKKIEVRHPTGSPERLYLFEDGKLVLKLTRCKPNENATTPSSSIRFSDSKKKEKK
ncbi:DDE-type integrase/transposase/recombinase [bacterium]|nr:DDE-type integrase/transposase/recombinase [bacterium]